MGETYRLDLAQLKRFDRGRYLLDVYRSPNSADDNTQQLLTLLRDKSIGDFDDVCILDDFNYPGIDWHGTWSSVRDNDFIECVCDAYLFQMVRKPTRCREGQQPNILDLVLVNDENLVSDIENLCPFGKSDNEVLYFICECMETYTGRGK